MKSHLISINPGLNLLSDSLYGTPIFGGGEAAGAGVMNEGGPNQIDPNLDPELAMAMRISLEEEKERQRKLKEKEEEEVLIFFMYIIEFFFLVNLAEKKRRTSKQCPRRTKQEN